MKSETEIEADERLIDDRNDELTKQKTAQSHELWIDFVLRRFDIGFSFSLFSSLSLSFAFPMHSVRGATQHLCHNLPMQRNSYDNPRDCLHWLS